MNCSLLIRATALAGLFQCAVTPAVFAKGEVMASPQLCQPDGYIRVLAPKGARNDFPVKNDRGQFLYCVDGHDEQLLSGAKCNTWGTALQYIQARLGRGDVSYAGMGVWEWSQAYLYLFYCLDPRITTK